MAFFVLTVSIRLASFNGTFEECRALLQRDCACLGVIGELLNFKCGRIRHVYGLVIARPGHAIGDSDVFLDAMDTQIGIESEDDAFIGNVCIAENCWVVHGSHVKTTLGVHGSTCPISAPCHLEKRGFKVLHAWD